MLDNNPSTPKLAGTPIYVVGGGLAGSECAWQLAERGHKVVLVEMRGVENTPAHRTTDLAELVCSNSFGSTTDYSAPGQLKWEAEKLGSLILKAAKEATVPAGMALGVDREVFARAVTQAIHSHPNIQVERRAIQSLDELPRPAVIASGPLTRESLAESIRTHLRDEADGESEFLYFFDAIAPIIDVDTINMNVVWRGDRFDKGTGDYLNCPFEKDQYFAFIDAIQKARKIEPKDFEKIPYFDGCMPIEVMVERGPLTPKFGPMSPNGLRNPQTGKKPFAVVQLRQENLEATSYNMVGFQTKMAYGDQKEVFRMIPGLEKAEFLKLGSIHRNMYIHTPRKLTPVLSSKKDPWLFFAGQITGVEGYFDSTCIGLLVARFLDDQLNGREISLPPRASALGSLLNGITEKKDHFQPTNINFGLFPLLGMEIKTQQDRELKRERQLEKAKQALTEWLSITI
jgi:methylenetetrahydrofolate--tRNA-(uracil-5-)-methyltransferase